MVSVLVWPLKTAALCCSPAAQKVANGSPLSNRAFAFPRHRRLCGDGAFSDAFTKGKRLRRAGFDAFIASNQQNHPRLGIAVPKKILSRAVDRNKIKRVVRDSYRQHAALLPPVDIVIRISSAQVLLDLQSLRQSLVETWLATTLQHKIQRNDACG